jgi:DNA repair exonuclease SbcCD ATPase subunit
MAKEACDFAEISRSAYAKSEAAVKQIGDSLDNMEQSTDKDYLKKRSEIEKIAAEMIKELENSVKYTMDSGNACTKARDLAVKGDMKKTEECLKDAKDAAENAMKGLKSVQKGYEDAKKKHMEAKKSLLKAEKEEAKERTSRAMETMDNELKLLLEDIDRQITEAKDLGNKKRMESLKQVAQTQKDELEYEKKSLEEELREADKYEGTLASLLLSAEFAKDYEEWMKIYKKCLEVVTLWELMENFSMEKGTGCIYKNKFGEPTKETGLKVVVTFDVKEDDVDTLEKICSKESLVPGDVPCSDCNAVP